MRISLRMVAHLQHFSLRSQIAWSLQIPDEFNCWVPFGVWKGWKLVRRFRPSVIYASARPMSAHVIGWVLKKITGLPLVLDFRDIWIDNPWDPAQPAHVKRLKARIERKLVCDADAVILNTLKALDVYTNRYAYLPADRFTCIPNGYDEADILDAEGVVSNATGHLSSHFTIVHTGTVYGLMDPRPLLQALCDLVHSGAIKKEHLRVDFYGSYLIRLGGKSLHDLVAGSGVPEVVRLNAPVPRKDALRAQHSADALLLIVPGTDVAVPSKAYEYLASGKPILALCPKQSATAQLILETRSGVVVEPYDVEAIKKALLDLVHGRVFFTPDYCAIRRYSSVYQTQQLASLLDTVAG